LYKKYDINNCQFFQTEQGKHSNSALNWRKTVLSSGTLSDKMAALTLKIQDSHVHNLSGVDTLVAMVGSKGRREALIALGTKWTFFSFRVTLFTLFVELCLYVSWGDAIVLI